MAILNTYMSSKVLVQANLRVVQTVLITDAIALTAFSVIVTFDKALLVNEALLTPSNWKFTTEIVDAKLDYPPYFADTINLNVLSVDAGDESETLSVVLETTEQTDFGVYHVQNVGSPETSDGVILDPNIEYEFEGIGEHPTVTSVAASGPTSIDIIFSENMNENAALFDVKMYEFAEGLVVNSVEKIDAKTVRLHTDEQTAGQIYNLLIVPRGVGALSETFQIPNGDLLYPSFLYRIGDMLDDQKIIAKYGSDLERITSISALEFFQLFQDGSYLDKQLWNSTEQFEGVGGQVELESVIWEIIVAGRVGFTTNNILECLDPATNNGWELTYSGTTNEYRMTLVNTAGAKYDSVGCGSFSAYNARHLLISFDRVAGRLKTWRDGSFYGQIAITGWGSLDLTNGNNLLHLGKGLYPAWFGMWKGNSGDFYDLDDIAEYRYNRLMGNF